MRPPARGARAPSHTPGDTTSRAPSPGHERGHRDEQSIAERWPAIGPWLDEVRAGRPGSAAVLVGEAGMGKTFLLDAIERIAAASELRILRIAGHETERDLALAGLHALLHQLRHDGGWLDVIPDRHRRLLDRALHGHEHIGTEVELGASVLATLAALAETRPTVLLVDDAHWVDPSSLRSVAFAVRRLRNDAVVSVFAARPVGGLPLDGLPTHELDGLPLDAAVRLLDRADDGHRAGTVAPPAPLDPTVAQRCWEASGGNPLALTEMARRLDDAQRSGITTIDWHRLVPERLTEVLAERVDELPPPTRRALLALAATGGDRWLDQALRFVDATRADLVPAERAGLVQLGAEPRMAHPLHAAAVLASADPNAVRTLHRRLGQIVDDPDRAAWHASCGVDGPDPTVADLVQASARRARERGLVSTAARLHEQAAALTTDPDLTASRRLDAASAWWFSSQPQRTIEVLGPLLDHPMDAVTRAQVALRHHSAQGWLGSAPGAAHRMLDEAERVRPSSRPAAVALACAATGTAALAADLRLAMTAAETAVAAAGSRTDRAGRRHSAPDPERSDDDPTAALMATTALAFARLIGGGRLDPVMASTFEAARRVPIGKLTDDQLDMVQFVGFALMVDEQPDEAIDVLEELRREAAQRGVASAARFAAAMAAEAYRRRGEWTIADARATPDTDDESWATTAHDMGLAVRARIRAHQGISGAVEPAQVVLARADRVGLGYVAALARAALAAAELASGDAAAALVHLDRIEHDVERGGGYDTGTVWYELDRLDALLDAGQRAEAERFVARLRRHGEHTGRAWSLAVASAGRAILDEDADATRAALGHIDRLGAPFEMARLRLLLTGHGLVEPTELGSSIDALDRLAARPWADRARTLSPTRPRRPDPANDLAGQLSPAELRVALTVAGGRSNAETAAELHLSPRTVEAHLRSIFSKLGVRNRTALATLVLRTLDDASRLERPG